MRPFRFLVEYFDPKTGKPRGLHRFAAVVEYKLAGAEMHADLRGVVESLRELRSGGRLKGVVGEYDETIVMVVRQDEDMDYSGEPRLIP
jgi:hypothetical protein